MPVFSVAETLSHTAGGILNRYSSFEKQYANMEQES